MSIFTCILSLCVVADDEFWTFFSRFAALCPFLLASFHFSWSLVINFGLFSQDLRRYVHFYLYPFVVADNEFWTFFSRFAALCPFSAQALAFSSILWLVFGYFCFLDASLCPFSLASFHFSWSHTMNFGLFSQDLLHYVHFRHRLLHSLPLCHLILDIFDSWCSVMSILASILSLFVVAYNEFWTFFPRFATLCPFLLASFHFSWSLAINFGLFSQELLHYVHFYLYPFTFRGRRQWILDFFLKICNIMSILGIGSCILFHYVTWFWIFLLLDALLCPFSLASFRFSWSQTMNFGLFSQDLRHYVHFRHRHLRFLQYDGLSIQYPTTLICKQLKIFLKLFCHVKSPP